MQNVYMRTISLFLINVVMLLFSLSGRAATDPGWSCDIHAYQYDMSVYLALRQDNKPVVADLVVAAFVGDECRGIAEAQSVKDASYYYLRVRSNEVAGDSVYFRIYDREKNKELATLGSFSFENLRQVGYPSQPWVLTLPVVITPDALEGVDETTENIQLTGTWTEANLADLKEKLQPEEGKNDKLSSVDMSDVVLSEDVTLEDVFTNSTVLTSVKLPDLSGVNNLSTDAFKGTNPNCVVFVNEETKVPERWGEDVNIVVGKEADRLVLVEHQPFHTPEAFTVGSAYYKREFENNELLRSAALPGWETICLPFDVDVIKAGERILKPVSSSDGLESGDFFIATLTDKGFEYTDGNVAKPYLKANTPYLINMVSAGGDRVAGEVTFFAGENISIAASELSYRQECSQYDMIGVFTRVLVADGIYAVTEAGNAFENGSRDILPFEAYLQSKTESVPTIPIAMYTAVTGVQLSSTTLSVEEEKTVTLSATILPADATNKKVQWSSVDESVATVSSSGIITGVKEGTTTIKVETEDGGFTANCSVTVTKGNTPPTPPATTVKVTGVTVTPDRYNLNVGETIQLSAMVKPSDATNKKVSWSSSDVSVASVNEVGLVSGNKVGNAVISVKTEEGNFKADSYITVNLVTSVEEIGPESVYIYPTVVSSSFIISGLRVDGQVELISSLGQVVKMIKGIPSSVNVSDLRAGHYIVKIIQVDKIYIFKMIKR